MRVLTFTIILMGRPPGLALPSYTCQIQPDSLQLQHLGLQKTLYIHRYVSWAQNFTEMPLRPELHPDLPGCLQCFPNSLKARIGEEGHEKWSGMKWRYWEQKEGMRKGKERRRRKQGKSSSPCLASSHSPRFATGSCTVYILAYKPTKLWGSAYTRVMPHNHTLTACRVSTQWTISRPRLCAWERGITHKLLLLHTS